MTVYVKDRDIETELGISLTQMENWLAGMTFEQPVVHPPGRLSGIRSPFVTYAPRDVTISFRLKPASIAERSEALSLLAEVFPVGEEVELRTADAPDKVLDAMIVSESSASLDPSRPYILPHLLYSVTLRCANPAKRDRYIQSLSFNSSDPTPTDVPVGTLPSDYELHIMGPATDPIVTIRNVGGDPVSTMEFTVALGATEYLAIKSTDETITKYTAGVPSNALSTWTNSEFLVLDPRDAPTAEVSSGSAILYYHRRYRA